jgi:hypothetical protein
MVGLAARGIRRLILEDWLVGWLVGWVGGCLVGGWVGGCLVGGWVGGCLVGEFIGVLLHLLLEPDSTSISVHITEVARFVS